MGWDGLLPLLATRESTRQALDVAETLRVNARIDDALASAGDEIERLCARRFYPELRTFKVDFPNDMSRGTPPYRIWLGRNEMISIVSATSGGVNLGVYGTDYVLRRGDDIEEPPYTRLELNTGLGGAFLPLVTNQQSTVLTGWCGYGDRQQSAGVTAAAVASTATATIDVGNSTLVGVGNLLKIDSERVVVTGKSMISTGQTVQTSALTGAKNNTTVLVSDGTAINAGETIVIDAERMAVTDIAGNALIVERAIDGTVLAAHSTGATLYAPRRLSVTRGAVGSTAATHAQGAAITAHAPPPLIQRWARAYALTQLGQEIAGYARSVGQGEGMREARGIGLKQLTAEALDAYQRRVRQPAI